MAGSSSRHGRREGIVPSVCPSRKRPISRSSMIPTRSDAPSMTVSIGCRSCSRVNFAKDTN